MEDGGCLMKQLRVLEEWNSYRTTLLDGASPIQIQECRRSFYAGAQALFFMIINGLTPGSEPEPADLEMLDQITEELKEFASDVFEGKA